MRIGTTPLKLTAATCLLAVCSLGLVACGSDDGGDAAGTSEAPAGSDTSTPDDPALAALVKEAKGEDRTITYYNPSGEERLRPMIDAFEQKYPFLNIEVVGGDPLQTVEKIISASKTGGDVGDIMDGGLLEYSAFADNDVPMMDYHPKGEAGLPADFPYKGMSYIVPGFMSFQAAYGTSTVQEDELPTSLEGYADPSWAGRIGVLADQIEWYPGQLAFYGDKGDSIMQKLAGNDIKVYPGHDAYESLAAGGLDVALNTTSFTLFEYIKDGAPIAVAPQDHVVAQPHVLIGLDGSDSKAAVKLFFEWVFSQEGQQVYAETTNSLPARGDVDLPEVMQGLCESDCKVVYETGDMVENFDKLVSSFQDLFIR